MSVVKQFFTKRVSVDAEYFGCMGLIVSCMSHDRNQNRFFNRVHDHVINVGRLLTVQILEIFL